MEETDYPDFEGEGLRPERGHSLSILCSCCVLLLGLLAGAVHEIGGYVSEADFYGMYGPGARALAAGDPYEPTRSGPGYSVLLLPAVWSGVDMFLWARALAAVLVAGTGYLSFRAFRPAVGSTVALLAQALFYIAAFRWSFVAGNDIPGGFWIAASLALIAGSSDRPTLLRIALAGTAAGMAFLTRYNTLGPVVAAGVLAIVAGRGGIVGALRSGGLFVAGAAVACVPWFLASQAWFGTPMRNKTHALVALAAYGKPSEQVNQASLAAMESRFDGWWDVLTHDPARLLSHYALVFYQDAGQVLVDLVSLPLAGFLCVGLVVLLAGRSPGRSAVLLGAAALGFLNTAVAPYQLRYHLPILPLLFLPAAAGLVSAWRFAPTWLQARRAIGAAAFGLLFSLPLVGISALETADYLSGEPIELHRFADAAAEHAREGDRVMARKPHLPFLCELEMAPLIHHSPNLDAFLTWFEGQGARFLYVGPREVAANPVLAPLAGNGPAPEGLERLLHVPKPASSLYLVTR